MRTVSAPPRDAPSRDGSERITGQPSTARTDEPDRDLHPARPVARDVAADDRAASSRVGTVQRTSTRSPDRTTTRRPSRPGGTLTSGVGPGGAPTVAASATSQASWTAASPMTTSWTSRPPLMTWSRTVSPGTRSTGDGSNVYSRAMMLTSRGVAALPAEIGGVAPGAPLAQAARSGGEDHQKERRRAAGRRGASRASLGVAERLDIGAADAPQCAPSRTFGRAAGRRADPCPDPRSDHPRVIRAVIRGDPWRARRSQRRRGIPSPGPAPAGTAGRGRPARGASRSGSATSWRSPGSTSRSPTASSSRCSGRPARARRRPCG